jgi:hypothetical protein
LAGKRADRGFPFEMVFEMVASERVNSSGDCPIIAARELKQIPSVLNDIKVE